MDRSDDDARAFVCAKIMIAAFVIVVSVACGYAVSRLSEIADNARATAGLP